MFLLKTLRTHYFCNLLRHQNTSLSIHTPRNFPEVHECFSSINSFSPSSFFRRIFSISTSVQWVSTDVISERFEKESTDLQNGQSNNLMRKSAKNKNGRKPLDVMFEEAVGLSEKCEEIESSEEDLIEGEFRGDLKSKETLELIKKLRNLIREVKSIKGDLKVAEEKKKKTTPTQEKEERVQIVQTKVNSLYSIFLSKPSTLDTKFAKSSVCEVEKQGPVKRSVDTELTPLKDLSPEMVLLANRLQEKGYLKKANFLPPEKLDLSRFCNHYSRDFLRFSAEKFGQDHQEMAKLLSGGDLKTVSLFGCPSFEKRTALAAKRLRSFFSIQEDIVCRPCKLKSSCKVVNQRVAKKVYDMNLADVMRVLTLYDMELVPAQLKIPNKVRTSVTKLLKDVLNLSQ